MAGYSASNSNASSAATGPVSFGSVNNRGIGGSAWPMVAALAAIAAVVGLVFYFRRGK
jgi:hypothetical protein